MSRNAVSRISQQPTTNIERSRFERDADFSTTMNAGQLVPFYVDDGILPSDTFSMRVSSLCRALAALKHPVIDNAYLDIYFFGVPWRLIWEHAEEFHGATDKAWNTDAGQATGVVDIPEYFIPTTTVPEGGYLLGSVAEKMGIPPYTGDGDKLNVLPFRAYQKAYNDYFRDGNLMDEVKINIGDDGDDDEEKMSMAPYFVCKFHDLFTSALPFPQRGDPVTLPEMTGLMPVFSIDSPNAYYEGNTDGGSRLRFNDLPVEPGALREMVLGVSHFYNLTAGNKNQGFLLSNSNVTAEPAFVYGNDSIAGATSTVGAVVNNLVTDASYAQAITINQLRLAIQMQAILEADARGGTRYTSLIRQHFGVISPDGRLQRAEYLGGKRINLNTQQVTATSGALTELGEVGAMSKTVDSLDAFVKSFTEHTVLIGVMCIRTDQSYQQGLAKMWKKRSRYDYYLPELAHIGEMPVKNHEIYWQGPSAVDETTGELIDDQSFGFNEAWYDYRFRPSIKTGLLRSGLPTGTQDANGNTISGSLDSWHYAEYYESLPHLDANWITQKAEVVDRTLAVSSKVSDQFLVQLWFDELDTRPLPLYSIPGFGSHF